jgi:hypothetical protein
MSARFRSPWNRWPACCLLLAGCATSTPPLPHAAEATGVPNPPERDPWVEEVFPLLPFEAPLDILLILQDGCCVDDELATFQLGAAGLVDWLRASQIDAHIGVITTDADVTSPDRAGRLREVDGRRWVETEEEDAGVILAELMDVGRTGSPNERGLRAMKLALQEPLRSGWNLGFRRPEAALQVVVLSDEDDQSENDPSVEEAIALLRSWQPDPRLLSFSAMVGFTPDCPTSAVAHRYLEIVERTGGLARAPCGEELPRSVQDLMLEVVSTPLEYLLARVVVPETLAVEVTDGERVSSGVLGTCAGTCFSASFDPVRNSVSLLDLRPARGPGNEVRVRYVPLENLESWSPGR